ncbi:MAG: ATP-dependent DNA helicase RecG [bacterium]
MTSMFDSVQFAKGVGPKMAELLSKIGISTIYDLMTYPPFKYVNRELTKKREVRDGEYLTLVGEVLQSGMTFLRSRKTLFTAVIKTESGYVTAKWFNNPYLNGAIKQGDIIVLSGKVSIRRALMEMLHPEYEKFPEEDVELIHTGRIVPVYHLTKDMSQRWLRKVIKWSVDSYSANIEEDIPSELILKRGLMKISDAVRAMHYPSKSEEVEKALERMKYSELFYAGMKVAVRKEKNNIIGDFNYVAESLLVKKLLEGLSFTLTDDQKNAFQMIKRDMQSRVPMNRLLMGDVGSGKTLIAAMAMLTAVESGYQSVLMAPTEILAQQHFSVLSKLFSQLKVRIRLVTSSVKERDRGLLDIERGDVDVVIGTHALIEDEVRFKDLKLVIIDEQHRFGVVHRSKLRNKGIVADYLVMTATPIPRSLSLAVYGEMDITEIKEKPKQQKTIKTKWVSNKAQMKMYQFIEKRIDAKESCFIVCPAIDIGGEADMKSVERVYEEVKKKYLLRARVGKIHSRLSQEEKTDVMEMLNRGEIDVLVGTTVIEVGIDVTNATVMVILSAERFGLSQLHQLRGRVGRGEKQSYCFLVSGDKVSEDGIVRLKTIAKTNDGFEIAEMDLRMRGMGEAWGSMQSGIPRFKYADWFDDFQLMKVAFSDASSLMSSDKNLLKEDNRCVKINLTRRNSEEID